MLIDSVVAGAFGTNCYVVAPGAGEECLVVDPGIEVLSGLGSLLERHRLRPAAVLLTHGHVDHVWSVTPVCRSHGIPALLHGDDAYRLRNPLSTLAPALVAMLEQQFGRRASWTEPDDVRLVVDGERLVMAGVDVRVTHTPGHTEGSVMFAVDSGAVVLSGDVLFAGSIGRTDLPGGDHQAMLTSLRDKVLSLDDAVRVLPGHGSETTIARERATNPYLLEVAR